jgi:hypothetical protein
LPRRAPATGMTASRRTRARPTSGRNDKNLTPPVSSRGSTGPVTASPDGTGRGRKSELQARVDHTAGQTGAQEKRASPHEHPHPPTGQREQGLAPIPCSTFFLGPTGLAVGLALKDRATPAVAGDSPRGAWRPLWVPRSSDAGRLEDSAGSIGRRKHNGYAILRRSAPFEVERSRHRRAPPINATLTSAIDVCVHNPNTLTNHSRRCRPSRPGGAWSSDPLAGGGRADDPDRSGRQTRTRADVGQRDGGVERPRPDRGRKTGDWSPVRGPGSFDGLNRTHPYPLARDKVGGATNRLSDQSVALIVLKPPGSHKFLSGNSLPSRLRGRRRRGGQDRQRHPRLKNLARAARLYLARRPGGVPTSVKCCNPELALRLA